MSRKLKKGVFLCIFFFLIVLVNESSAQCAMCKTSVESNHKEEVDKAKKKAEGLNTGILYLMVLPYILGGVIYYMWRKNSLKEKENRVKIEKALSKIKNEN